MPSDKPLAARYDVALLDLDGVLYLGDAAVPGAVDAVAGAREMGLRLCYVTNNASRTPSAVAEHLAALGFPATVEQVVTSAQAAARVVVDRMGVGRTVLPVGGAGLRDALTDAGCRLVESADDRPDVVVQGWAPDVCYRDLAEAALAVGRGAWWLATNRDQTLPSARGIQPGNGALVGAVQAAVGHPPHAFAGKPDPALLHEALRRTGATRPLMVGDRLDTDIDGALRVGIDSLCVLTGVSDGAAVVAAPEQQRPTYLALDLAGLLVTHPAVHRDGDEVARCGGWRARRTGTAVRAEPVGGADLDAGDLLRAIATVAWEGGRELPGVERVEIPAAWEAQADRARLGALIAGRRRGVG